VKYYFLLLPNIFLYLFLLSTTFIGLVFGTSNDLVFNPINENIYVYSSDNPIQVLNSSTYHVIDSIYTQNGESFLGGLTIDPINGDIYASTFNELISNPASIVVINGTNNIITKSIPLSNNSNDFSYIVDLSFNAKNQKLYAIESNSQNNSLVILNSKQNSIIDKIPFNFSQNIDLSHITFNPNDGDIYITSGTDIMIINSTNKIEKILHLDKAPLGITFSHQNNTMYLLYSHPNRVVEINPLTMDAVKSKFLPTMPFEFEIHRNNPPGGIIPIEPSRPSAIELDKEGQNMFVLYNLSLESSLNEQGVYAFIDNTSKIVSFLPFNKNIYYHDIAFNPENGNMYVTNRGSGTVSIIDKSTNEILETISVGGLPSRIAFNPENGNMYVTNQGSGTVSIINSSTNRIVENISIGNQYNSLPTGIAFNPENGNMYVTNQGSGTVSIINSSTNRIVENISVGGLPSRIAFNPENGNMYIADWNSSTVKVIDSQTHNLSEIRIDTGIPYTISYNPTNSYIYVTALGHYNRFHVINSLTNDISESLPSFSGNGGEALSKLDITFNPVDDNMYMSDGKNIVVINSSNNEIIESININANYPISKIAFNPETNYMYLSAGRDVLVVDLSTKEIVKRL
jgi:YVTN family beta-propeller protein